MPEFLAELSPILITLLLLLGIVFVLIMTIPFTLLSIRGKLNDIITIMEEIIDRLQEPPSSPPSSSEEG